MNTNEQTVHVKHLEPVISWLRNGCDPEAAAKELELLKTQQSISIEDIIEAGDSCIMNEQAALLRECRLALDDLLKKKPMMAALVCGSTTLGNLRASLYDYRPRGVFGGSSNE